MREILFRAKAINRNKGYHRTKYKNGDWVYGLITRLYDEQFENIPAEMTNEYGVSGIEIDHKTIGQFTGLIDKNGAKVFEGDILKGSWETVLTIFYDEISSSYRVKTSTGHERDLSYYGIDKWEIIGNIHDNPELLRTPQNDEVRE